MNKVYEIVQKKILERLERAIESNESFTWVKPWRGGCVPTNFKTKNQYRGCVQYTFPLLKFNKNY